MKHYFTTIAQTEAFILRHSRYYCHQKHTLLKLRQDVVYLACHTIGFNGLLKMVQEGQSISSDPEIDYVFKKEIRSWASLGHEEYVKRFQSERRHYLKKIDKLGKYCLKNAYGVILEQHYTKN